MRWHGYLTRWLRSHPLAGTLLCRKTPFLTLVIALSVLILASVLAGCGSPSAASYAKNADQFASQGKTDEALEQYNKSIEVDANVASTYYNRGNVYATKGDYDSAILDYNKAIELDAQYTSAYFKRGVAYSKKGNHDAAIFDYAKTVELSPQDKFAYYNRGYEYLAKGNYDAAIIDYGKVIELDPNYTAAHNNLGKAYSSKNQHDSAIAEFSRAIELDPSLAVAYYNRGDSYVQKGNNDTAITDLNKAIEIDPSYALAYYDRGVVYSNKSQWVSATADFAKAIELDSTLTSAYYKRAVAYLGQDKTTEAVADFARVVATSTDTHQVRDAVVEANMAAEAAAQSVQLDEDWGFTATYQAGQVLTMQLEADAAFDQANRKLYLDLTVSMQQGQQSVQGRDQIYFVDGWLYLRSESPAVPSSQWKWVKAQAPEGYWDDTLDDAQFDWFNDSMGVTVLGTETVDGVETYKVQLTPDASDFRDWLAKQTGMKQLGIPATSGTAVTVSNVTVYSWIAKDTFVGQKLSMSATIATGQVSVSLTMTQTVHDVNATTVVLSPAAAAATTVTG